MDGTRTRIQAKHKRLYTNFNTSFFYYCLTWEKTNKDEKEHIAVLKGRLTFSGSTPMSSQNFSMPSGPTTSSVPAERSVT